MKVFISWSGHKSNRVAIMIDEWLQCTIQSCKPWLSSKSIDRGALWFNEIAAELADTTVGIICLTKENKDKPWILFESGALAKGLSSSRVCTLLIDLEPADLENPLAQFNHTVYTKSSLQQLLNTINSLSDNPLQPNIVEKVFEKYWPEFEKKFDAILAEELPKGVLAKRSHGDMLSEILNTIRGVDQRMVKFEENASNQPIKQGQFLAERTQANVKIVANLLATSMSREEVAEYIMNQWGYSESQMTVILEQAQQLVHGKPPTTAVINADMLEQLKERFGK